MQSIRSATATASCSEPSPRPYAPSDPPPARKRRGDQNKELHHDFPTIVPADEPTLGASVTAIVHGRSGKSSRHLSVASVALALHRRRLEMSIATGKRKAHHASLASLSRYHHGCTPQYYGISRGSGRGHRLE